MNFLIDHNLKGHALVFLGAIALPLTKNDRPFKSHLQKM
jgi:hypothetical protein